MVDVSRQYILPQLTASPNTAHSVRDARASANPELASKEVAGRGGSEVGTRSQRHPWVRLFLIRCMKCRRVQYHILTLITTDSLEWNVL